MLLWMCPLEAFAKCYIVAMIEPKCNRMVEFSYDDYTDQDMAL